VEHNELGQYTNKISCWIPLLAFICTLHLHYTAKHIGEKIKQILTNRFITQIPALQVPKVELLPKVYAPDHVTSKQLLQYE